MSQIRGKQIKDQSVVLDKLSGTGSVTFLTGAGMTFNSGSNLYYTDAPTQGTEVANKDYVDSVASGLEVKEAAQAISLVNIGGTYNSGVISGVSTSLQIDGITILDGARVVLNGQTAPAHNGIYVYDQGAGTLTRSTDFDEPSEVNGGEFVFIKEGNTYADTGWVVSTPDGTIIIGTNHIQFTQFSSAGVINAGLGLLQTGNTFDIITGVGLTASANELKLDNTTVTTGNYGSADTVSTFTVDQQGRLTAAGTATIDITASQVNDFDTAVNDEVFDAANFVDSASVDFDVTAGATVSAYVKTDTTRGADINASGVFVKIDGSTITYDGSGNLQAVIPAATVTGASNGLDLSGTDVILGGTLSQNTTINGAGKQFVLDRTSGITLSTIDNNADIVINTSDDESDIIIKASGTDTVVDIDAKKGVLIDADTVAIGQSTGTGTLQMGNSSAVFDLDFNSSTVTSANSEGLVYTADYSSTFVDESLITKRYVDNGTASIWTAINAITGSDIEEITAGNGLTGGGTQGTVNVAVGDGAGIQVNANSIEVEITAQGGLTFSAAGAAGTLQIAYDSNTLNIVDGELTVVGGSAQPVYQAQNSLAAAGAPNGGADTGLFLASTPSDYSRIEVYVNGQKQLLGGQGNFNQTNSDCWFGSPTLATPLTSLTSGAKLYWNSVTAGFKLDTSDLVEIAYEA